MHLNNFLFSLRFSLRSLQYMGQRGIASKMQTATSDCAGSLEGALGIGSNGPWAATQLSKTSS